VNLVPLSQVCRIVNGGTPKSGVAEYWGGGVAWLTPAEMGKLDAPEIEETVRTITAAGLRNSSAKQVPVGSVIMSTRAPIGHLAVPLAPMAFNQGCRGLVPDERLDTKYLYYFLWFSREALIDLGTGTTFKELSTGALGSYRIPLPPLEEQRRLIVLLDEAFGAIATATANAEKNLVNARELFTLALNQELGRGAPEVPLKQLCVFENGDRGENYAGRSAFVEEGIPIINAGHLVDGGIDTQSMNFITRERFDLLRSGKIRRGDILFCLRGSLGKFAFNDAYDEGAIASSLIIIRPGARILPDYLCAYLRSDLCVKMIRHYENGAAQPNLGGKSLEKFLVPLPDLSEQQAIIDRLAGVREATQDMGAIYQRKLSELSALKQSLFHRAFSGELTEREPLAA
jgi:type I restriction enzyme S subunit